MVEKTTEVFYKLVLLIGWPRFHSAHNSLQITHGARMHIKYR